MFDSEWIHRLESERHWREYWYQQKLMKGYLEKSDKILEIGCGSGFTSNYLRSKGYNLTTLDIDKNKRPDIVANIVEYEFPEEFDCVLAFEVFEHIPFKDLERVVSKLKKACRKYLFLSVPYNEKVLLHAEIYVPRLGKKVIHIAKRRGKIIEKHHHWELGLNISDDEFHDVFCRHGFTLISRAKRWIYSYLVFKKRASED